MFCFLMRPDNNERKCVDKFNGIRIYCHIPKTPFEKWDDVIKWVEKNKDYNYQYIPIINPDDFFDQFYNNNYMVVLSEHGPYLIVNAHNEVEALDIAIDFADEQDWHGLFLDEESIDELIEEAKIDSWKR